MAEWFEKFPEKWWFGNKEHVTEPRARFIRTALNLRKGECFLDAPCGDGELSVYIARRGIHVTGIDITRKFVLRAKRRFRQKSLSGNFYVMDLRDMEFEGEFNAVCNWFGSFGYFSNAENLDVIRRYARALKADGRILIDQPNREYVLRNFIPRYEYRDFRRLSRWIRESERVESLWSHIVGGRRKSYRVSIRFYTPLQFRNLFASAGLRVTAMFSNWNGEKYRRCSHRLVVVGENT